MKLDVDLLKGLFHVLRYEQIKRIWYHRRSSVSSCARRTVERLEECQRPIGELSSAANQKQWLDVLSIMRPHESACSLANIKVANILKTFESKTLLKNTELGCAKAILKHKKGSALNPPERHEIRRPFFYLRYNLIFSCASFSLDATERTI